MILVYCRPEQQLERALRRPGATEADVRARLARQMPLEEKKKYANFAIDTSGDKEDTLRQTRAVWEALANGRQAARPKPPSRGWLRRSCQPPNPVHCAQERPIYWRKPFVPFVPFVPYLAGEGAGQDTRGRVCSPESLLPAAGRGSGRF